MSTNDATGVAAVMDPAGFDDSSGTPLISDPGKEGWAPEPKTTNAERLLYGDLAGVVRLLGQAAIQAGDAYSLTCKAANEPENGLANDTRDFYRERVQCMWQLYVNAAQSYRETAQAAAALRQARQRFNDDEKDAESRREGLWTSGQVNMGGPVSR